MQFTAIPVEPQVGGASPLKPDAAQSLPVIDSVDLFANAYDGADASASSPEKTISPDVLASGAAIDVPAAPSDSDFAPPLPAPQSAPNRGVPLSLAVKGERNAPESGRLGPDEIALNARAKPPTLTSPAPAVGPRIGASVDPAPPKPNATVPDRPAPPQPRTDAAAPPIPQDHNEMLRPQRDPDARRSVADIKTQPAAPVAPVQSKSVQDDTAASQVVAPKTASATSNRGAERAVSAPTKPAASVSQPHPAPKIDIRPTDDGNARPNANRALPLKPRQVTRDLQPTSGRPLPPDAPARPKARQAAQVSSTPPLQTKDGRMPVINHPAISSTVELPVRLSVVGLAAQPTVTLPTARAELPAPQSMSVVSPSVASDPREITVEIVTRPADRQSSKTADRAVPELPRPMPASPRPTPISPQPSPGLPQPTLEAPQSTPAPLRPIQTPTAQGIGAHKNPANRHIETRPALDPTPRLSPSKKPTSRSDPDRAPRPAAPQVRVAAQTRAATMPVAPALPNATLSEISAGSFGQLTLESLDPILTPIGSDGPISTDRALSLDVPRRSDAGLARAELARSVAAQIGDAARTTSDGKIEVRLSPEELARVRLSMTQSELGMSVTITAERAETLELIRRNTDLFAQDLRHLGHQNIDFSFEHQEDHQPSSEDADTTDNAADRADTTSKPGSRQARVSSQINDGRLDIRL